MLKTDFFLSQMELDNKENLESSGSSKMEVGQSSDSKTEPQNGLLSRACFEMVRFKLDCFKIVYVIKSHSGLSTSQGLLQNGLLQKGLLQNSLLQNGLFQNGRVLLGYFRMASFASFASK